MSVARCVDEKRTRFGSYPPQGGESSSHGMTTRRRYGDGGVHGTATIRVNRRILVVVLNASVTEIEETSRVSSSRNLDLISA